ncbi:MAG: cysteine--tRNA ligase [Acidobacteriota bacterium]
MVQTVLPLFRPVPAALLAGAGSGASRRRMVDSASPPMIRFHNTLTGKIEVFEPLVPGRVGLYTCGPTVYSYAHIGNFRTFVWEDFLRRFIEARGFLLDHVMNLTDVDDKIIQACMERGEELSAFTAPFVEAFFEDLDALSIRRAHHYPRATEHVPEMVALIERLRQRGLAYEIDGSFYYRIASFPDYGCLSGKNIDDLRTGASGRVESDEYDAKDDVRDFALWKAVRPGEPSWDGPSGPGRPGWHVECSAMSMKYLGESFDIHTGGVDNIFPHHENEIAQSQGATGRPLACYWLHAAHLVVDGEKMSKSKGNFFTLRDLVSRGISTRTLRYFLLSAHYRRVLDLTDEALAGAEQALRRLDDLDERLATACGSDVEDDGLVSALTRYRQRFEASLDEDLNASGALGALFEAVRELNGALDAGRAGHRALQEGRELLAAFHDIFGVNGPVAASLPPEIDSLIREREAARRKRDFAAADRLRDDLLAAGYSIEDTAAGPRWRRVEKPS